MRAKVPTRGSATRVPVIDESLSVNNISHESKTLVRGCINGVAEQAIVLDAVPCQSLDKRLDLVDRGRHRRLFGRCVGWKAWVISEMVVLWPGGSR